nr:putative heat shock protein 70 family [Tanacetum cinerariifolium]
SNTGILSTAFDNQSWVGIRVYQGERARSSDNLLLGDIKVLDIPLAPKGLSKVMVGFEIDVNGILTVTAGTVATGKIEKLTITNTNGRLSKDEIEKMVKDAQKYKFEDQEFKKKVDAYNDLENCIYKMKKKIEECKLKKKVSHDNLEEIKKAIADMTKWLDDNQAAPFAELQVMKIHLEFVCKLLI